MTHGGKRQGAGRPAGAVTQKTREVAEAASAAGLLPLDYMLKILRDETADSKDRMWAAEKAAPYVHAKLNSVEHKGGLEVTTQTKEQRDAAVAAAVRADS
ncbi:MULTISPECIES: hypothetical protein [unclassified Sinorhizobium]|uniref:hypothetical protein n=1 Tax=unclassified Sinorhizobium TaxID=2613772 RepID=UPI00352547E8